jgi:hypothetical protein
MERHNSGPERKQLSTLTSLPSKTILLIEGEIKTFHNKEKLKEFVTTKPALQKILKRLLHIEEIGDRKTPKRINPFEQADQQTKNS